MVNWHFWPQKRSAVVLSILDSPHTARASDLRRLGEAPMNWSDAAWDEQSNWTRSLLHDHGAISRRENLRVSGCPCRSCGSLWHYQLQFPFTTSAAPFALWNVSLLVVSSSVWVQIFCLVLFVFQSQLLFLHLSVVAFPRIQVSTRYDGLKSKLAGVKWQHILSVFLAVRAGASWTVSTVFTVWALLILGR